MRPHSIESFSSVSILDKARSALRWQPGHSSAAAGVESEIVRWHFAYDSIKIFTVLDCD